MLTQNSLKSIKRWPSNPRCAVVMAQKWLDKQKSSTYDDSLDSTISWFMKTSPSVAYLQDGQAGGRLLNHALSCNDQAKHPIPLNKLALPTHPHVHKQFSYQGTFLFHQFHECIYIFVSFVFGQRWGCGGGCRGRQTLSNLAHTGPAVRELFC